MDNNVFDNPTPNVGPLTFAQAFNLLGMCQRLESRDHFFGDREVHWSRNGVDVAEGYFGGGDTPAIYINEEFGGGRFAGEQAYELVQRGTNPVIGRNDETGPDEYMGA